MRAQLRCPVLGMEVAVVDAAAAAVASAVAAVAVAAAAADAAAVDAVAAVDRQPLVVGVGAAGREAGPGQARRGACRTRHR